MRVLVIGGTNFIGPHVVRRLCEMDHEAMVFHRGLHETALPAEVRHIHSALAGIPVVSFPEELRSFAPDIALHMVAMGERDAQAVMRAFKGIARRVVAASSGDVYRAYGVFQRTEPGPLQPVPLTEDSPLRQALYPYRKLAKGPSDWMHDYDKILVERAILSDPELPGTILRLPMVFGPDDPGHRLFYFLKRMDDGRPAILLDESQARWRWTNGYVENVAAAIALAVTDERAAGRIYNVGEPATPTQAEWVGKIGGAAGWSGRVVALPPERLPAHLRQDYNLAQDILMDTARIRRELGYAEAVTLEEALRHTVAWERANPPEQIPAEKFDYAAEDAALAAAG